MRLAASSRSRVPVSITRPALAGWSATSTNPWASRCDVSTQPDDCPSSLRAIARRSSSSSVDTTHVLLRSCRGRHIEGAAATHPQVARLMDTVTGTERQSRRVKRRAPPLRCSLSRAPWTGTFATLRLPASRAFGGTRRRCRTAHRLNRAVDRVGPLPGALRPVPAVAQVALVARPLRRLTGVEHHDESVETAPTGRRAVGTPAPAGVPW